MTAGPVARRQAARPVAPAESAASRKRGQGPLQRFDEAAGAPGSIPQNPDAEHGKPAGGLKVRAQQCATCIYRPDSVLDLAALEAEAADPALPGHFARWRACHGTRYREADVVCAGFYARHAEDCTPIQVATRLGGLTFIRGDS